MSENIKTNNPNGVCYVQLEGLKLGDVFEYISCTNITRHYVISFLYTSMNNPMASIVYPDGFSDTTSIESIKKDKYIKNIDWWKIHDEYLDEANMYMGEQA